VFILVVSDEGGHAAQVEEELKDQGLEWRVAWTDRAEVALTGDWNPDILVCASRVGSSNGRSLLGQLRKRHPDAIAILLMDSGDGEDAMEALEVSHRVLAEPLDPIALIEAVESVLELRTLLSDQGLKTAIGKLGSLPAAPRQYLALTRLLRDPDSSSARVVEAVAKDPAVAAKVLRLSNSAYYSGGREISDLRTAVTRLGQNSLLQLVLANEVFSAGASSADADAMRDRALRISQLAGRLLAGPSAELASTAGLLAEVGLLLPPMTSSTGDGTITPHGVAGAYLLGLWGLPSPIVEAVAFHQNPARLRGGFWVAGAVHVAAAIVNDAPVDEGYLRTVGQLDRLPRWRSLADEMAEAA
jgi:HD-like signal output (HDOD) protein/CheY-like chemotaxis protein